MKVHLALLVVAAGASVAATSMPWEPPPQAVADDGPRFETQHWPPTGAALRGRDVYERWCIGCHGDNGEGDGSASMWLDPLPRNFQAGNFKFRSTPSGELPTEEDVLHVITCGLQGSSMPGFPLVPEQQRRDVARYVLYLAEFGLVEYEASDLLADGMTLEEVLDEELDDIVEEMRIDAWEDAWPVSIEPAPEWDEDSVELGRELYQAQCVACHGETGRGDGSSSFALRDWKDARVVPRDFTTGVFRAGSSAKDVFLRLKVGVNGTPMPQIYGSDEELWAITHYILSLQDPESRVEPHPTSCDAHRDDR